MYSSFDNNPEIFVRKEIYAPKLFVVRVRTVLLWREAGEKTPHGLVENHRREARGKSQRERGKREKPTRKRQEGEANEKEASEKKPTRRGLE